MSMFYALSQNYQHLNNTCMFNIVNSPKELKNNVEI